LDLKEGGRETILKLAPTLRYPGKEKRKKKKGKLQRRLVRRVFPPLAYSSLRERGKKKGRRAEAYYSGHVVEKSEPSLMNFVSGEGKKKELRVCDHQHFGAEKKKEKKKERTRESRFLS